MKFRNTLILGVGFLLIAAGIAWAKDLNTSGRCSRGETCNIGDSSVTSFTLTTDGGTVTADGTLDATTFSSGGDDTLSVGATDDTVILDSNDSAGVYTCTDADANAACSFTGGGTGETTIGSATSETINFDTNGVDGDFEGNRFFTITASSANAATIVGADAASPGDLVLDATDAGSITVGSVDVLSVTITTDDTGDGTDFVVPADSINSSEILTIVESIYWPAIDLSADGAQCADAAQESTIAGPELYVIVCTDNDAGLIGASVVMPDSWDAGTVTFEYTTVQTGAETLVVDGDMEVQCRGDGETIADTWSAEVAMTDAAQVGSSGTDMIQTASAITPAGTCAAGDLLIWQYSVDATGTTATVATNNFIGFKMEYTSNVGD